MGLTVLYKSKPKIYLWFGLLPLDCEMNFIPPAIQDASVHQVGVLQLWLQLLTQWTPQSCGNSPRIFHVQLCESALLQFRQTLFRGSKICKFIPNFETINCRHTHHNQQNNSAKICLEENPQAWKYVRAQRVDVMRFGARTITTAFKESTVCFLRKASAQYAGISVNSARRNM